MTERERLLEKLGKVKALADRGEGGEKESAERTLAALMKRYGITEEDLEDTKATIHWIRYKTDWERRLLGQLAYMHLKCSPSQGQNHLTHCGSIPAGCSPVEMYS